MPFDRPDGVQQVVATNANAFPDGVDQFSHDLATSIRETFYAYDNRPADSNRSAQSHMGPSEIGSPCDRRIAMSLMGVPPVNPGGDGFAAWLGTQGHRGMADIYEYANGNSGRFAVETRLSFPSKLVPRGTGDLLDRMLRVFVDWKFMGHWSLKKLIDSGPSQTYKVQLHTYGYGAVIRGEKVDRVALVGMPRQGTSLDEMFVWSEPLDLSIGKAAIARVEAINERYVSGWANRGGPEVTLQAVPIAKDCKYCPFHLPKSNDLSHACNGKA